MIPLGRLSGPTAPFVHLVRARRGQVNRAASAGRSRRRYGCCRTAGQMLSLKCISTEGPSRWPVRSPFLQARRRACSSSQSDEGRQTGPCAAPSATAGRSTTRSAIPRRGGCGPAGGDEFQGAGVWTSEDGGDSWKLSLFANGQFDEMLKNDPDIAAYVGKEPAPPAPFTGDVEALWSLGRSDGRLYAGAKPAALYESADGGATWARRRRAERAPVARDVAAGGGGAGPAQHRRRPGRAEEALGRHLGRWRLRDGRRRADMGPAQPPLERGGAAASGTRRGMTTARTSGFACTTSSGRTGRGDLLYQQNHHGVFRSVRWRAKLGRRDGGAALDPSASPSRCIRTTPRRSGSCRSTATSRGASRPTPRPPSGGRATAGGHGPPAARGCPQRNCFFTVLRQAMATDRGETAGVYFGTNSGSVFASFDEGDRWHEIARHLPTVLSVETLEAA